MERKHGRTQSGLGLQGRVSSERSRVSVSECKKSDKMNIGCGASRVCGGGNARRVEEKGRQTKNARLHTLSAVRAFSWVSKRPFILVGRSYHDCRE